MMWMTMFFGCVEQPPEPKAEPAAVPARPPREKPQAMGRHVTDLEVSDWLIPRQQPGAVQLVVFWELWCPHCKREIPKLDAMYERFREDGLEVVGLTRLTRNTPVSVVRTFLTQQEVGYPVGVGGHELAKRLGVTGIPSAVVVRDGTVIWSGHPARVTETQIETWLGGV